MFVVVLRYLFLTNFVSICIAVIKKEYSNTQDERNKQANYNALKGHKYNIKRNTNLCIKYFFHQPNRTIIHQKSSTSHSSINQFNVLH